MATFKKSDTCAFFVKNTLVTSNPFIAKTRAINPATVCKDLPTKNFML